MAFDGLLRAWSDERILFRDAAWCVVDKPAGVACGPAGEAGVSPASLEARLAAHGLGRATATLRVAERASGATLLARGDASPPATLEGRLPEPIEELTCVVAVDDFRLPPRGSLALSSGPLAEPLTYQVLRRQGARALLEVRSRVSAERVLSTLAHHAQPAVGDEPAPSAVAATRVMLHVSRLHGRVSATAPLPPEFGSWLVGRAEPPAAGFAAAFLGAGISRFGLAPALGAFRLIGEEAGELSGVTVECYADYAVLLVSSEEAAEQEAAMAECLMDHGARGVYVKRRVRADLRGADPDELAPPLPLRGSPAPAALSLRQGELAFEVCLGDGLATGLFLDQRANWERVRALATGASFLNLFSYTGAFTIAAAAGGARSTTSVDLAGRALARLDRNLKHNALSGPAHRLLKADVPVWLGRAQRAARRFDCIVLDPPSFGTRARGVLSTRRDNPALLEGALALLEPGGRLLCVSHHRRISTRELGEQVTAACAARGVEAQVRPLVAGWDCPTLPGVSGTKSVLAQLA